MTYLTFSSIQLSMSSKIPILFHFWLLQKISKFKCTYLKTSIMVHKYVLHYSLQFGIFQCNDYVTHNNQHCDDLNNKRFKVLY